MVVVLVVWVLVVVALCLEVGAMKWWWWWPWRAWVCEHVSCPGRGADQARGAVLRGGFKVVVVVVALCLVRCGGGGDGGHGGHGRGAVPEGGERSVSCWVREDRMVVACGWGDVP